MFEDFRLNFKDSAKSLNFCEARNLKLEIKPLKLAGSFEINIRKYGDERGYFMETYKQNLFAEHGLQTNWVQENQSLSEKKNTLRGLHFQSPPSAQTKLVRAVQGEIFDVFVDLRKDSATYGEWDAVYLSAENCKCVYVPRGFAHGFRTLTENAIIQYKVDNLYAPEHDKGIRWNDPDLAIDWQTSEPILSAKDADAQFFKDFVSPF